MGASYRFTVKGRVQGVFFRQSARQIAERLGLSGWVRNRTDGAVEGLVSGGDTQALQRFREWLQQGPPSARVDELSWEATAESVSGAFEVRR
jgi:acylphosphatase